MQHTVFEIPIGGENFQFRLGPGPHERIHQIVVYDVNGRDESYKNVEKVLDGENVKGVAKQILTSLNESIGRQTYWKDVSAEVKKKHAAAVGVPSSGRGSSTNG